MCLTLKNVDTFRVRHTFTDGIDTYTEINKLHPYNYKDCIYMHKPYHAIAYVKINSCAAPGKTGASGYCIIQNFFVPL